METPTLPKGYFFKVVPASLYDSPKVLLCKRKWLVCETVEWTINLTDTDGAHPDPEHVHRGMAKAKKSWEAYQAGAQIYGNYPPKKLG